MVKYITSVEHDDFDEMLYGGYLNENKVPETKQYYTERDFLDFLWWNIERMDFDLGKSKDGGILDESFLKAAIYSWTTYKEKVLIERIDFDIISRNVEYLKIILSDSKFENFMSIPIKETDLKSIEIYSTKYGIQAEEVVSYSFALYQSKICYDRMKNAAAKSLFDNIRKYKTEFNGFYFNHEGDIINDLFELFKMYSIHKDR